VADEVRALADRSVAESAGIARSVADIRRALERATALMNRTRDDVLDVAETAGGLLGRFDQIVAAAEDVAEIGQRIADSSRETARGSAGLADSLSGAVDDARRAAAETEQLARASADQSRAIESLNAAAVQLDATAKHLAGSAAAARSGGESSAARPA
jgi:methyl-accepting chemotaxis protein